MKTIYDFTVLDSARKQVSLNQFKGHVVLIVNVASKCGYTPQYAGLEELYQKYKDRNFVILGFPCNQFLNQEPGSAEEIEKFCQVNYGVSFPVMNKINVNGALAEPLYQFLKASNPGFFGTQFIKWNFTKFLVDRNGIPIGRFGSKTTPEELSQAIENALEQMKNA